MKIRAIDHVQLSMPAGEEARARAFYGGVLGLPETPKPPELAKRGGAWFENGAVRLHLGVDKDFRPATRAHVALIVDELEALLARCREAGMRVEEGAEIEGVERGFVFDPFGNRIELVQPKT